MASAFDWQSQTKHPPTRSIRSLCSSHLPCVDSFTSPIGSGKRWSNLRMPYPRFIREYLTYRFVWITFYQGDSLSHYLSLTHVSLCVIPLCGRHETRTRNPIPGIIVPGWLLSIRLPSTISYKSQKVHANNYTTYSLKFRYKSQKIHSEVPPQGFEPWTRRLKGECSNQAEL